MNTSSARPDPAFIEKQRQLLTELRSELLVAAQGEEDEEADERRTSAGEAREQEEDAQKLATLELEGNLVVRALERLTRVDRALQKIEEGTYGFSDLSAQPIPRERLVAVPEAVFTLDEEQLQGGTPPLSGASGPR